MSPASCPSFFQSRRGAVALPVLVLCWVPAAYGGETEEPAERRRAVAPRASLAKPGPVPATEGKQNPKPPASPRGDSAPVPPEPRAQAAEEQPSAKELFLDAHGDFYDKFRRFVPLIEVSTLYMGKGRLHNESGDFQLWYYKLDALAPIPLGRDVFLLAGAHGGARDYDFDDVAGADDEVLYNAGLRLGAGYFFSDDLVVNAYWQPSLYSDLDGTLNSRDWRLWYGSAVATYRVREDLFLKGGVTLTDAVDTGALPVAGVSWLFHPAWRFDVLLPRNIEVSWWLLRALNLQLGIEMEAEEFHIRFDTPAGESETDVHVQDYRAYLGALYRFTNTFSVFAKTGMTVAGRYDWRDGSGEKYDGSLEPGFFVQAGLGVNF